MGAWVVEIVILGAFGDCPVVTRSAVYCGVLAQLLLLCEGLLVVGQPAYMPAAAAAVVAIAASLTARQPQHRHGE